MRHVQLGDLGVELFELFLFEPVEDPVAALGPTTSTASSPLAQRFRTNEANAGSATTDGGPTCGLRG